MRMPRQKHPRQGVVAAGASRSLPLMRRHLQARHRTVHEMPWAAMPPRRTPAWRRSTEAEGEWVHRSLTTSGAARSAGTARAGDAGVARGWLSCGYAISSCLGWGVEMKCLMAIERAHRPNQLTTGRSSHAVRPVCRKVRVHTTAGASHGSRRLCLSRPVRDHRPGTKALRKADRLVSGQ